MSSGLSILSSWGLEHQIPLLEKEGFLDISSLSSLTDDDLRQLGWNLADRKKLMSKLTATKGNTQSPGSINVTEISPLTGYQDHSSHSSWRRTTALILG